MKLYGDEKGMALLFVLLVITLLSALVLEFSYEALVDLRMAETFRDRTRAGYIARGGIVAGQMFLREDNNGYDALDELWAQGLPNYPVDEGAVSIQFAALDGRLDLNRLVTITKNTDGEPVGNPTAFFPERLERLLEQLGEANSVELVDALIDWLDPDSQSRTYGAEQDYYLGLAKPYACKNGPLDTIEELLQVRGFNRDLIDKLRPHVTLHGGEKVNINTASAEVLASLGDDLSLLEAREVAAQVRDNPIADGGELQDIFGGEAWYTEIRPHLQWHSDNFRLHSRGEINEAVRLAVAEIDRKNNRIYSLHLN